MKENSIATLIHLFGFFDKIDVVARKSAGTGQAKDLKCGTMRSATGITVLWSCF